MSDNDDLYLNPQYGRGRGYAELAARRVWRLAGLSCLEDLFELSDVQILEIPGVGQKTVDAIRRMQRGEPPGPNYIPRGAILGPLR